MGEIVQGSVVCVYPWDVLDDPGAAAEISSIGVPRVSLACAYHSTRVFAPHNPKRSVISAPYSAAYFAVEPNRYRHLRLTPQLPDWIEGDSFGKALDALRQAGLKVGAWTVLLHNSGLGEANRDLVIQNAFGDRYTHALCPAQPEVREYAATLVADICEHYPLDGLDLEACGYMGYSHLSHHEKSGVEMDLLSEYLLSICFCDACRQTMANHGVEVDRVEQGIRMALTELFGGLRSGTNNPDEAHGRLIDLLGIEATASLIAARDRVNLEMLDSILSRIQSVRPAEILVNAASSRYKNGAFLGVEPSDLAARVDTLLLSLWHLDPGAACTELQATVANVSGNARVLAGLRVFPPDFRSAEEFAGQCLALAKVGASGFSFYHYGLCPRPNLDWIRHAIRAVKER
jgi:hypothetical protein